MKLNLQLISKLSMTLAFWVLTNYSGWSQIMAMAQSNHKSERATTNELLLNNVLNEQKDRYHADFMFERKIIEGLAVSPNALMNAQKLEKNIEKPLKTFVPREVNRIDRPINGKVIDAETGEGLPGASIIVKGTSQGTTTDINGDFTLNVPDENTVLEISYVGFITVELAVGSQSQVTINLKSDAQALSEVVVIGYGEQRKSDLTGAVASIQTKDITRANPTMAARAIQGQVAGATVTKNDNRPGSGYSITIRGENTINNSTQPLVVIDGIMGGDLNTLNPNDIQTMDVLKDASSTAIYGSRGANGVIIVTTKKGASGKPRISYDSYIASRQPAHVPRLMNAQEFYKSMYTDRILEGATPATFTAGELAVIESGQSTDWVDLITKPGLQTSQNLSLSGGNDRTTYRFAGGFLSEDGNVKYTGFKRYNLNAGLDSKIGQMFRVGFTSYLTYSDLNVGSQESLRGAFRARPSGLPYYDDLLNPTENKDLNINGYAVWMGINDKQVPNPLLDIDPAISKLQTTSLVGTANTFVEFSPVKGLSFRSSISASYGNNRMGDFRGTWSKAQVGKKPRAQYDSGIQGNYTIDNIVNYDLAVSKHKIHFTGLQSSFYQRNEAYRVFVTDLPYDSDWYALNTAGTINTISSSLAERSLLSYMGRINYSFNDKYLLTLTGRSDGASQLAPGNKWAFFPSVAVAWRAGEEQFIRDLNLFSNLKARISYGEVGNSTVNPYSTQAGLLNTGYDFGGTAAYGFAPANLGNKDLRWERSKELNLGLDFGFFNNRIAASLEVYDRKTDDLILNQKIPTVTGFSDVIANVGKIQNRGVELTLSTVNITKSNFSWSTNFTFTKNNNELLELYGDGQTVDKGNKLFVGHPIRSNFDYEFAGIWQTADKELAAKYKQVPGAVRVVDQNNDGIISSSDAIDDRTILGSALPNYLMGMTNRFNYKSFDFSFFMYYRNGSEYSNSTLSGTFGDLGGTRYNRLSSLDYWRSDNPSNTYFGVAAANPYRNAINYQDASFLRVSDITLGYTLPLNLMNRWKLAAARVYTQVTNPFIFTKYDGFDPEFNSAIYQDDLPYMNLTLGVNISF
ncbi:MAG: TonB-dependent receptor [Saprospiraceae bacterium]|nr:TonB-dependent receptor [Saprospiraceae bacterium]